MDIQKEREAFEDKFPIPAHWIDFCGLTCKYICKYNVIDDQTLKYQARWEAWLAAKAQAVPEHTNQTFEDWLSDPENTKVYLGGYRERANEFAHQAWIASLKAKLPKDKILMPRSLDQKHIDYVVHQLAISSGASLISEVYECLIEAQEPAND